MKKLLIPIAALLCILPVSHGQKVIFLHHSTGGGVYFQGNVAGWITNYNTNHNKHYEVTERSYPDTPYPWANYPYDYWNLWINPASTCNSTNSKIECINTLVQSYNVIIYKHCFPGAGIGADEATSAVSSESKTLGNYKLQYRSLRTMMDGYPNNKFIVWTLAPLHRNATTTAEAARAKQFVDWVKTTWLTEDGKSHPNIFIFDFWGIMAETNATPAQGKVNCLKYAYEGDHNGTDSHPNATADQVAGPLFGQCIVNAIEKITTATPDIQAKNETSLFPNPSDGSVALQIKDLPANGGILKVIHSNGQMVFQTKITQNFMQLDLSFLKEGLYLCTLQTDTRQESLKLVIAK